MENCCSSSDSSQTQLKEYKCPVNGRLYKGVSSETILHHIKSHGTGIINNKVTIFVMTQIMTWYILVKMIQLLINHHYEQKLV
jgi:hypothetical protein